jgi:O-antigen/teichoic acid export membrane protein
MKKLGQVRASAVISYLTVVFTAAAGLIYTPWMVASVGRADYGLYTLAMSLVSLFLLDFGIGQAVSKFLSEYRAKQQGDRVNDFLGVAYRIYLVIAAACAIVLIVAFFLLDRIYAQLGPAQMSTFRVLYLIVASYSVLAFPFAPLDGILLSSERLIALRLCTLLQKVLTVLLIVCALLLGWGVLGLVTANAAASLVFVVTKLLIVRRTTTVRANFIHADWGLARRIFSFSGWVAASQVALGFVFNVAPSILAIVSGAPEIAVFGIANALESYVFSAADALNGLFLPRVSRIVAGEDPTDGILDLMVTVGRIQTYIIGLIVIGFACVGRDFVVAWMGASFTPVYFGALLLMIPCLIELPQQIASTTVLATNNVKAQARVYGIMAVLNIVLMFVLARLFGAVGACAAIAVSYLVRTLGMNVVYSAQLGIDVFAFFRRTYGSWLMPASFSLAFGLGVNHYFALGGWLGVGIKALLVVLVYSASMYSMGFNDYEKRLVGASPGARGLG